MRGAGRWMDGRMDFFHTLPASSPEPHRGLLALPTLHYAGGNLGSKKRFPNFQSKIQTFPL